MLKPKIISYIQCGCGEGKIEVIAQTYPVPDSEGKMESTCFLKCSNNACATLFRSRAGEKESRCEVRHIEPYTGTLAEDEIRCYAQYFSGRCDVEGVDTLDALIALIYKLFDGEVQSGCGLAMFSFPTVIAKEEMILFPFDLYKFKEIVKSIREAVIVAEVTGRKGQIFDQIREAVTAYSCLPNFVRPWARRSGNIVSKEVLGDDDDSKKINTSLDYFAGLLAKDLDKLSYC